MNHHLLFGSELKALIQHPIWQPQIDRRALATYTQLGYVPAPDTIYQNCYKVLPSSFLTFTHPSHFPEPAFYRQISNQISDYSDEAALEQLELLLCQTVKQQMVADVPVGAFLSGGIDSSTIVALMSAQATHRVKTFSIGFTEIGYNEATHAKAVADYLGTDHTEIYITAEDAKALLPRLLEIYDEPMADVSQIPTFFLSQLAHQQVTVSLSGDGGDELFAGYNRYFWLQTFWERRAYLPLKKQLISSLLTFGSQYMPSNGGRLSNRLAKLSRMMQTSQPDQAYAILIAYWLDPVVLGATPCLSKTILEPFYELIARLQQTDMATYLPDDILTKVDRASMATSLEARIPFLNHEIVEFASQLPLTQKFRNGERKWLLTPTSLPICAKTACRAT